VTTAKIEIPPKLLTVFSKPRGYYRYRGAHGGRGSGKTRTFALMTAVHGYQMGMNGESGVILCAREHLNSLDDSSMEEIKQAIRSVDWLSAYWEIGEKYIRSIDGRIKYVFAGLRHNLDSIKSKAKILLCWIDEAETVSETAYKKLIPTVREANSEIWVTWNPEKDGSPTDLRFRKRDRDDSIFVEMNYMENPWFPDVLDQDRLSDLKSLDPQTYAHIWEGAYLENSDSQVFANKVRVAEFKPGADWDGPYCGLDFGFSLDPTAATKCWVYDGRLWVEYEAGRTKLELDDTTEFITKKIPDFHKYVCRADSARPESISYLVNHGMPRVIGVDKWKGSVEDGVQHMRSYKEIVVHPRCEETRKEMRMYSYKVDRLTGDVLPDIVDKHNHYIDSIRYGISPLIQQKRKPAAAPRLG